MTRKTIYIILIFFIVFGFISNVDAQNRVLSLESDGDYVESIPSLPFYKTIVFLITLSIIAGASLLGIIICAARYYHQRREAQRLRDQMLEQEHQNRQILEVKNAELEQATQFKSDFLASMSHEIRTPTSGIIGFTEIVLETPLTPHQRQYLETVKTSADALLVLLNDILDLSKIEAGKLEMEVIRFNLRDVLSDAVRTLALRADQKGLELVLHVQPDVPDMLLGDPVRLRQIVINLVGNAIKFTEEGEIVVAVETESQTDEAVCLHFAVRDTGIGIPKEKQEAIFQTYGQADASTTREYGGTGLGLAISAQLVELFKGRMWLESEVDKGSTFHFSAHFALQKNAAVILQTELPPYMEGLRVLAVDDNKTNQSLLEEMLTHWGMKPTVVLSAEAALKEMQQKLHDDIPFDLVLTDVNMPEMDGFALAERIKANHELNQTPIIILTSASRRGDVERCRQLGISAHLIKPIKQSVLFRMIINVLCPEVESQPASDTEPMARQAEDAQDGTRLRILLAEDNAVNQRLMQIRLQHWQHSVVVVSNGKEVLDALEKERFDVLLTDVQMPEMDGFEVTRAIRATEKVTGGHLPIIAMTANAMKGDQERCLEAGMDDYVSKPIQQSELINAIRNVVSQSYAAQTPATSGPKTASDIAASPVFDHAKFLDSIGGDVELVKNLVRLFLDQDCPRLLSELQEAVAKRDSDAIASAAHGLKGLVGEFFAQSAYDAALELEIIGRDADLSRVEEAYTCLNDAIEKLKEAFTVFVNEIAG